MRTMFLGTLVPQVEHFFTSLEHRISVTGLVSVGLAVLFLIAYGILWVVSRSDRPSLTAVLEPYQLTAATGQTVSEQPSVLSLPFLDRLAAKVQSPAANTRFGRWLDEMLDRAGSRLRVGELLTIWAGAGVVLMVLAWFLAGLVGLLIVLCLSIIIPIAALQAFADRRAKLFAAQLPDVLKLTSSSLRAGFSLLQGLDSVARQMRDPSKTELQRVLAEARLGRPLEEALEAAAARIRNRDFTESVVAVRIQQESGGNLAALFDTLAETMVQRVRMRREVRTLTAEGRLSAYILGIMPIGLGLFIFAVNRSYIMVLFHTFGGKVLLIGGMVLEVVGFFWMYKTVKIDT